MDNERYILLCMDLIFTIYTYVCLFIVSPLSFIPYVGSLCVISRFIYMYTYVYIWYVWCKMQLLNLTYLLKYIHGFVVFYFDLVVSSNKRAQHGAVITRSIFVQYPYKIHPIGRLINDQLPPTLRTLEQHFPSPLKPMAAPCIHVLLISSPHLTW